MGFEGPPARPPVPPAEKLPVQPDESQRVEDVAKAQEMAQAGNEQRSWAARDRKAANSEENPNKKEWFESGARMQDKKAEYNEEVAGRVAETEKAKEKGI